jgi:hypothetical protein
MSRHTQIEKMKRFKTHTKLAVGAVSMKKKTDFGGQVLIGSLE